MNSIAIPANGWRPRGYQMPAWGAFESGVRRICLVWHRRAGKDELCLNFTATEMVQHPASYWHMLPKANQVRKAIWDAVNPHSGQRRIDEAFPRELRTSTREQDMFIRIRGGATWQALGSDNFEAFIGSPPRGVVFSEYAQANPAAWDYIRPILVENGGWALFIYTPRGKTHGYRLAQLAKAAMERCLREGLPLEWYFQTLTVADTGVMSPQAIERELVELTALHGTEGAQAIVDQEYFCSFETPVQGAVFGGEIRAAEREGRITAVPYDPSAEVILAWDFGISDATAIWFAQRIGREWRIIDYVDGIGNALEHYVAEVRKKPYVYAAKPCILPHDGGKRQYAAEGGKSIEKQLAGHGLHARTLLPARSSTLANEIAVTRAFLKTCVFDEKRCERGLDALRSWHYERDEELAINSRTPVHDWSSHGADAFTHLALGEKPQYDSNRPRPLVAEGTGEVHLS